jgi:tRNA(Ile)-lysidine synthase TilS/MesJ
MVMLSILKHTGADVSAVHIIYGNRTESEHEYRFLTKFCSKIDVQLIVYRIKWLRRGEIDRQFYENMTRELRFYTYRSCDLEPCILLGHLKEDVIENIWTNIANCHHLENLKKMKPDEIQYGVRIMRPLLMVKKSDIYKVSQQLAIPYLKNSTPAWSNRGKFREHFHKATIAQFGEKVDNKIIDFAEAIHSQNNILNILLYEPIYMSFKDNCVNISTAVKAKLDTTKWLRIFEHICHKHYGISKPSINSVRDFCRRLYMHWRPNKEPLKVVMSKKMTVSITMDIKYDMEFIVKHFMTIIIV